MQCSASVWQHPAMDDCIDCDSRAAGGCSVMGPSVAWKWQRPISVKGRRVGRSRRRPVRRYGVDGVPLQLQECDDQGYGCGEPDVNG